MADIDVRRHSVTKNDIGDKNGASVWRWVLYPPSPKTRIPAYWSPARDALLRQLFYEDFHDFWTGAVGIAVTKLASLGWELESAQPRVKNYFQDLLLAADDNQSWVKFLARHLQDYLGTDNGAFVEVVRATSGAGSRIIGLMHLDSLHCTRTGDPQVPLLYRDTKGITHEVKAHQVLMFADMPSPSETYHGVGWCATSRAIGAIRKMEAIERYIYEKISGTRALALDLLGGVLSKDIETAVQSAKEANEARGNESYLGSVMIPVPSDVPLSHVRINFAELPDGFVYDTQVNNCILVFANAIGLDVQDLQPLTGRPLGTATQSQVLEDKSEGKGLASWRQQWTHLTNQYILPDTVTFTFSEKDLRDQQRQADVDKTNADTVGGLVDKAILDTNQAKQLLADLDVIPQEFVPQDVTPTETIADSEKPDVENAEGETPPPEETPPEQPAPTEEVAKEFDPQQPRDEAGRWSETGGGGKSGNRNAEETKLVAKFGESQPQDFDGKGWITHNGHIVSTGSQWHYVDETESVESYKNRTGFIRIGRETGGDLDIEISQKPTTSQVSQLRQLVAKRNQAYYYDLLVNNSRVKSDYVNVTSDRTQFFKDIDEVYGSTAKAGQDDGHWITVDGNHVFVKGDGGQNPSGVGESNTNEALSAHSDALMGTLKVKWSNTANAHVLDGTLHPDGVRAVRNAVENHPERVYKAEGDSFRLNYWQSKDGSKERAYINFSQGGELGWLDLQSGRAQRGVSATNTQVKKALRAVIYSQLKRGEIEIKEAQPSDAGSPFPDNEIYRQRLQALSQRPPQPRDARIH